MTRVVCVTIDAHDPVRLAAFWADALGWELEATRWTGDRREELFWGRTNDYRNVVMCDPEGNEFCLGTPAGPAF